MAVLFISEFPAFSSDALSQMGCEPSSDQTVAIGGSSTASTAFKNNTQIVRLNTDVICSVSFGTSPTATATTKRLSANSTEYFQVPLGAAYKVAVITNT